MRRDLDRLSGEEFDVLVVGGGILGACVARDASSRGYRVALVEDGDFAGGTSRNSLKIVHGGLRYLRSLDLRRARESIRERSTWLRIAPHLVEPLPVVLGAYGGSLQNRAALWAGMAASDCLGWDRNRGLSDDRRLPRGRLLSAEEVVRRAPELARPDLTGGALFPDAQMYSSERLVLEVLQDAARRGAALANYVRFEGGLGSGRELRGGRVKDMETGASLEVRARMVVNAAGPASAEVARALTDSRPDPVPGYTLALNLVLDPLGHDVAFGLPLVPEGMEREEVPVSATRQLFVVPWRDLTLVGTGHFPLPAVGSAAGAEEEGDPARPPRLPDVEPYVESFLASVNRSLPGRPLERSSVRWVYSGLLPRAPDPPRGDDPGVSLLRRRRIVDHAAQGVPRALTGVSVKFTTARLLAEELVDRAAERLGGGAAACTTARDPLPGARGGSVEEVRREARRRWGRELPGDVVEHLVRTYGSRCPELFRLIASEPELGRRVVPGSPVVLAQFVRGVDREMAREPEDLIERRTELGAGGAVTEEARLAARRALGRR